MPTDDAAVESLQHARRQIGLMLASGILAFLLQLGTIIWYESSRNTMLLSLAERVSKLEETHAKDADKLASIDKQLGTIAGQLQVITTVLLSPDRAGQPPVRR